MIKVRQCQRRQIINPDPVDLNRKISDRRMHQFAPESFGLAVEIISTGNKCRQSTRIFGQLFEQATNRRTWQLVQLFPSTLHMLRGDGSVRKASREILIAVYRHLLDEIRGD